MLALWETKEHARGYSMRKNNRVRAALALSLCLTILPQQVYAQEIETETQEVEIETQEDDDPGKYRLQGVEEGLKTRAVSQVTFQSFQQPSKYSGYTIQKGIDVSKYNGKVDWSQVKASGVDFAIVRVGYRGYGASGTLNIDERYIENIEGAIKAGINVGVYMFSQATTTAEAQAEADYILAHIKNYNITLPVVMDFEFASNSNGLTGRLWDAKLSKTAATNICNTFCQRVKAAGYTPMVYADKNMLTNYLNANNLTGKVWLAHYTGGAASSYTGEYEYWQCASTGYVPGISGNVDLNFRYIKPGESTSSGGQNSTSSNSSTSTGTTSSGVTPMKNTAAKTNGTGINVRKGAGTSYGKITTLGINKSVTITGKKNSWYQVSLTVSGKKKTGFIKNTYLTILSKPVVKSASATSKSKVKLKWGKVSGASGYLLQRSTGGSYKTIKTIKKGSTVSYTNTGLKSKKTYKYRIRAYKIVRGKKVYSSYSSAKSVKTK